MPGLVLRQSFGRRRDFFNLRMVGCALPSFLPVPDKPMSFHAADFWIVVTHLGAAGIMLPLLLVIATELWLAGQKSDLLAWMLAMSAGGAIVLGSKIAFIGWGWGSASLDFTGVSGHTMLATSILPVWMGRLLAEPGQRFSLSGVSLGLVIGAAVGVSRLALEAHSPSEVMAGWLLGLAISLTAYTVMRHRRAVQGVAALAAPSCCWSLALPGPAISPPTSG